uniref:Superoxide dismutase copper/zinc binding domain-containing protein n=1 Tax=Erpetoichthys calabaricus TaxID=27687 RepID=A0A8C4S5H4_ERPCA
MIITAVALLRGPVIGTVIFSQLKSNPYSDMSIFMEVSTSNDTASKDHGWHVHDANSNYSLSCQPDCPFACEVGKVQNKNFFTDTTSSLAGITSVLGRSLVIHGADRNPDRIACANITNTNVIIRQKCQNVGVFPAINPRWLFLSVHINAEH